MSDIKYTLTLLEAAQRVVADRDAAVQRAETAERERDEATRGYVTNVAYQAVHAELAEARASDAAARKALLNLVRWYDAGLVAGDPPMSRFESARALLAGTPGGEGVEADDDVLCDRCDRCPGVASDGSTPYCHFCSHECTFTRAELLRHGTNAAPASAPSSGDPSGSAEAMARAREWAWVIDREHADETDLAAALNSHGTITEKRGREAERAEIVAWLRAQCEGQEAGTVWSLHRLADDIESRAHARGKEAQS